MQEDTDEYRDEVYIRRKPPLLAILAGGLGALVILGALFYTLYLFQLTASDMARLKANNERWEETNQKMDRIVSRLDTLAALDRKVYLINRQLTTLQKSVSVNGDRLNKADEKVSRTHRLQEGTNERLDKVQAEVKDLSQALTEIRSQIKTLELSGGLPAGDRNAAP
ncbi:MAG: hypothetical protein KY468_20245 [Armatimonadetes bacterium]|nr:hypothetical protein [Armatimonadota bacterium]